MTVFSATVICCSGMVSVGGFLSSALLIAGPAATGFSLGSHRGGFPITSPGWCSSAWALGGVSGLIALTPSGVGCLISKQDQRIKVVYLNEQDCSVHGLLMWKWRTK